MRDRLAGASHPSWGHEYGRPWTVMWSPSLLPRSALAPLKGQLCPCSGVRTWVMVVEPKLSEVPGKTMRRFAVREDRKPRATPQEYLLRLGGKLVAVMPGGGGRSQGCGWGLPCGQCSCQPRIRKGRGTGGQPSSSSGSFIPRSRGTHPITPTLSFFF